MAATPVVEHFDVLEEVGFGCGPHGVVQRVFTLSGPFARERLANWNRDLEVRRSHWDDALAMRDSDLATSAFGMGVGRFPQTHFWRSREPVRAGSYALESAGDTSYLRLGAGAKLYMDQIVDGIHSGPHQLKVRLKASKPGALLEVSVCEKWMLTSRTCVGAGIKAADVAGTWSVVDTTLDLSPLAESRARTVKFSLHTPTADTVVDVASVALLAPSGRDLLVNGDFARGLDRWFFSTDVDPPWHVHSLPVAVLFDQGWFGVAAWTLLIGTALHAGVRHARAGHRHAAAALAGLLAFLVSGSLNTLIDEPRFLFLLLLLTALAGRRESAHKSAPS